MNPIDFIKKISLVLFITFAILSVDLKNIIADEISFKIENVKQINGPQKFIAGFSRIIKNGKSGEFEPTIESRNLKDPYVFVLMECSLNFPGNKQVFNLDENFILIDGSGDKHIGYQFLKNAWSPGESFKSGWIVYKSKNKTTKLKI